MNPYLAEIREARNKVKSSQTQWNRVTISQPSPDSNIDVEALVAKNKADRRAKGIKEETIAQLEQADRQMVADDIAGTERACRFICAYSDGTYWCEIISFPSTPTGSSSEELMGYHINYCDNRLAVELHRGLLPQGSPPEDAYWMGNLKRAEGQIMPMVGVDNLTFLTGVARTEDFSEYEVPQESAQDFVLEKTTEHWKFRTTFSKQYGKPTLEEMINLADGKLFRRVELSDYQLHSDQIWMPHKVIKTFFRGTGKVSSTQTYQLLSAAYNSGADVSVLQQPLPLGANVNDYRFAPRPGVRYKIREDGIPSDAAVLQLVERREANGFTPCRLP